MSHFVNTDVRYHVPNLPIGVKLLSDLGDVRQRATNSTAFVSVVFKICSSFKKTDVNLYLQIRLPLLTMNMSAVNGRQKLSVLIMLFIVALRNYYVCHSCPEMFCKNIVLKNFAKFKGNHLCWSLFFKKSQTSGLQLY